MNSVSNRYKLVREGLYLDAGQDVGTNTNFPEGQIWHFLLESVKVLKDNNII